MDLQAFYKQLEELLEVDAGTITGATVLKDIEGWDSMAVMSFIAMVDEQYGLTLPPKSIAECATVDCLAKLIEQHRAAAVK